MIRSHELEDARCVELLAQCTLIGEVGDYQLYGGVPFKVGGSGWMLRHQDGWFPQWGKQCGGGVMLFSSPRQAEAKAAALTAAGWSPAA